MHINKQSHSLPPFPKRLPRGNWKASLLSVFPSCCLFCSNILNQRTTKSNDGGQSRKSYEFTPAASSHLKSSVPKSQSLVTGSVVTGRHTVRVEMKENVGHLIVLLSIVISSNLLWLNGFFTITFTVYIVVELGTF